MSRDPSGGVQPRNRVAVLQSNYIPWKGYFDIIRQVDTFVFHDDLQYTKNDWRNRNRIKTPSGPDWLTIPCGTDEHRLICDVRIDRKDWQSAHWRRLEASYRAAPSWSCADALLRPFYLGTRWAFLSELNQALIRCIARDVLGLATTFDDSRRLRLTSRKTERLVDLLTQVGATDYLSGPAAKAYLEPALFAEAGIALHYVDYTGYPAYPQLHGAFVHEVSIVDLIAHTGPHARQYVERRGASVSA
jgi:WbqC-like protein family